MINFTVGPVQSNHEVRAIGAEQVPYFRTPEFSALMKENEQMMLEMTHAPQCSRVCFMTCSGTGAMEAVVANCFGRDDKLLIVDGGSFGHRFVELAEIYQLSHDVIKLQPGQALTAEDLAQHEHEHYTAFLVNMHETSTGVLYDAQLIADFCKRNDLFLVCDSISSFLCDPFDMQAMGVNVMITSSQKALACAPGISVIVLDPRAISRVESHRPMCMYLDLKLALKNGERGQTPFTPAVGILRQIHARLCQIKRDGGVEAEIERRAMLAQDFRNRISHLPFVVFSENMSNAVTPLHPLNVSAYDIFTTLKDEYGIWVCPNGGELADTVFRVGHIGDLSTDDNTALINAFDDLQRRGLI